MVENFIFSIDTKKFYSIGYTFLIDKNGKINQLHNINETTSHTYNYNNCSIGIALVGNFEVEEPTKLQIVSLTVLLNYLLIKYNITSDKIKPHSFFGCETGATACCGKNLDLNKLLILKY